MAEVAGCLAFLERDIPRARMLIEEGRRLGRIPARAAACFAATAGLIQALEGQLEEAAQTMERSLPVVREGAPWEECVVLGQLALVLLALERPDQALACADRMEAAFPRLGATSDTLVPRALRAVARRLRGDSVDEPCPRCGGVFCSSDRGTRIASERREPTLAQRPLGRDRPSPPGRGRHTTPQPVS